MLPLLFIEPIAEIASSMVSTGFPLISCNKSPLRKPKRPAILPVSKTIKPLDENGNPYSPSWYTLNFRTQYQLAEDTTVTATLPHNNSTFSGGFDTDYLILQF